MEISLIIVGTIGAVILVLIILWARQSLKEDERG